MDLDGRQKGNTSPGEDTLRMVVSLATDKKRGGDHGQAQKRASGIKCLIG